jgi:hypothetical protein
VSDMSPGARLDIRATPLLITLSWSTGGGFQCLLLGNGSKEVS